MFLRIEIIAPIVGRLPTADSQRRLPELSLTSLFVSQNAQSHGIFHL
jgi:hypothetical protein